MKKLICIGLFSFTTLFLIAQTDRALVAGVKNNQFLLINYAFDNSVNIGFMNSLFIREPSAQYIRFLGSYNLGINKINANLSMLPYFGWNYGGVYFDMGMGFRFEKFWIDKFETSFQLTPFYDSSTGFYCSYSTKIGYKLDNDITISTRITDYPEFRLPENRITFAISFNVSSLVVKPELSLPFKGDIRTSRFQLSFLYNFMTNSKNNTQMKNMLY